MKIFGLTEAEAKEEQAYVDAPLSVSPALGEFLSLYPNLEFTRKLLIGRGNYEDGKIEISIRQEPGTRDPKGRDTQKVMHEICHFAEIDIPRAMQPNFGLPEPFFQAVRVSYKTSKALEREIRATAYHANWANTCPDLLSDGSFAFNPLMNIGEKFFNPLAKVEGESETIPYFGPLEPLIAVLGRAGTIRYVNAYWKEALTIYTFERLMEEISIRALYALNF